MCGKIGHGEVEEDIPCGVTVQLSPRVVSEIPIPDTEGVGKGLA